MICRHHMVRSSLGEAAADALLDIEYAWHMSEARSDHFRAGDTRETNNSQPNQRIKLEQDLQPFDVLVAKVLIENVSNYTESWGPRR